MVKLLLFLRDFIPELQKYENSDQSKNIEEYLINKFDLHSKMIFNRN